MGLKNYKDFMEIDEMARRPKVCPVLDFNEVRATQAYKDLIGLGFQEEDRPEPHAGFGKSDQYIKQGNLTFSHKSRTGAAGYPQFMIKGDKANPTIRVLLNKEGKTGAFFNKGKDSYTWINPGPGHRLETQCLTVDDYVYKISFLIKWMLKEDGYVSVNNSNELLNDEDHVAFYLRKVKENPNILTSRKIPTFLRGDLGEVADKVIEINDLKLMNTIETNIPELWKAIEDKIGGRKASTASRLGDLGF